MAKIYLAAPLFNPPQISLLKEIETALVGMGYEIFSPRLETEKLKVPADVRKDPKAWRPVFNVNVEGLEQCDIMVAVLDYPLPEHTKLCVTTWEPGADHPQLFPVQLPDAGTVWEMGYFFSSYRPIIGYTTRPLHELNLMLTQCLVGIVSSVEQLIKVLDVGGDIDDEDMSMEDLDAEDLIDHSHLTIIGE